MRRFVCLNLLFLILTLAACGGGGGGGGSGSSGKSASTGIRTLHGAIDTAPVEIRSSSSSEPLGRSSFAVSSFYLGLPTGISNVSLHSSLSGAAISSFPVSVQKGQRQTLLLYGDRESVGLHTALFNDDPGEIQRDTSVARVLNALLKSSFVVVNVGQVTLVSKLSIGTGSQYEVIGTGAQSVSVQNGSGATIFSGLMEFRPGHAYTLLVTGENDYFVSVPQYEDR